MATAYRRAIHTVDSHTEGNPTRVIVGGVPVPPGATLLEKRAWLQANDDGIRRMLNFEPRGSSMMCSVLLLPPENPGSDFAAVIMDLTIPGAMGGAEAMEKLRELDPQARVLVASGYANDPIMAHYGEYGFAGAITKPIDIQQLAKALRGVL